MPRRRRSACSSGSPAAQSWAAPPRSTCTADVSEFEPSKPAGQMIPGKWRLTRGKAAGWHPTPGCPPLPSPPSAAACRHQTAPSEPDRWPPWPPAAATPCTCSAWPMSPAAAHRRHHVGQGGYRLWSNNDATRSGPGTRQQPWASVQRSQRNYTLL